MSDDPHPEIGRLRARYTARVTSEHVRQRVSVRYLVDDPDRGQRPTDVVGRLLAMDDDALLLVDRAGRLHVVGTATVVASRVVPEHPRLPAEPDVGTAEAPLQRQAARVLLLDPEDHVLLVSHAPDATRRVWTAPGGGLEPGEDPATGARRELAEEIGVEVEIGPWVWSRRVTFSFRTVWLDQQEKWFLARTDHRIDPADAPLDDAGAVAARWWSVDELLDTDEDIAPAALGEHLAILLRDGPPPTPVDVGR